MFSYMMDYFTLPVYNSRTINPIYYIYGQTGLTDSFCSADSQSKKLLFIVVLCLCLIKINPITIATVMQSTITVTE